MNTRSMTFSDRDLQDQVVPGHRYLHKWITSSGIPQKAKILDIGCWTGPLEQMFEHSQVHMTGVDIDEAPLKWARTRFPKYAFVKASVTEGLPFDDKTFDVVCFFMVIEHVLAGTEGEALKNISRVTKKGGKLFMSTMLSNPLSNVLDPAYFLTSHRHYSKSHLTELLNRAGFKVEHVYFNGGWFTTLHIWLLYFFKHILHLKEPRGPFMDWLMSLDYQNKGFCEIEIMATKVASV